MLVFILLVITFLKKWLYLLVDKTLHSFIRVCHLSLEFLITDSFLSQSGIHCNDFLLFIGHFIFERPQLCPQILNFRGRVALIGTALTNKFGSFPERCFLIFHWCNIYQSKLDQTNFTLLTFLWSALRTKEFDEANCHHLLKYDYSKGQYCPHDLELLIW